MSADIRIGTWVFRHEIDDKYRCPKCSVLLKGTSAVRHLDAHDRREERKRAAEAARSLGMGAKALPGQLGMLELGVPDVPLDDDSP